MSSNPPPPSDPSSPKQDAPPPRGHFPVVPPAVPLDNLAPTRPLPPAAIGAAAAAPVAIGAITTADGQPTPPAAVSSAIAGGNEADAAPRTSSLAADKEGSVALLAAATAATAAAPSIAASAGAASASANNPPVVNNTAAASSSAASSLAIANSNTQTVARQLVQPSKPTPSSNSNINATITTTTNNNNLNNNNNNNDNNNNKPAAQPTAAAASTTSPPSPSTLKLHPTGRELKVEDALLYLDQVKLEFGNRPRIYNEFLEIMKLFKAQEVDTVGVIHRVRTLFRGYNNLILGFNTFLPEGYKIEMREGLGAVFVGPGLPPQGLSGNAPLASPPPQFLQGKPMAGRGTPGGVVRGPAGRPIGPTMNVGQQQLLNNMTMPGRGGRGGGAMQSMTAGRGMAGRGVPGGGPAGAAAMQQKVLQQQKQQPTQQLTTQQQQPPTQQASSQPFKTNMSMDFPPNAAQQQQPPAHRAVEFDHAIMYVTNIKKRFANQPITYHTFLEILHTYQKEQRGIKEVLEQVSSLFADHPDLLREFTFFLPDAVQEQAKERLSRAAAEAEAKQRAAMEAASKADGKGKGNPTGWRGQNKASGGGGGAKQSHPPPLPGGAQKFIDMTVPGGTKSPKKSQSSGGIQKAESFVYNSGVERQFFDAVKATLFSYSRDGQGWAEFIKTLDMYAQEILSRNDMLGYVERLLGKNHELFNQFKCIIAAVGAPDAPAHDDSWHSVPLSEIDFSRCRRCTPSYRALPRDYPNPPCSERSEEETKVLNDTWVSLPVGSEESYTFRHMRKNQYEEVLFRCEDMRFEIDMCIDGNAATLQRLEKIYDELVLLSKTEGSKGSPESGLGGKTFQYTLDGRVLSVIHKHTIKRIYGDDGPEMLDLCFRNPAVAIPIVVNRLRQKDKEWRAAKEALNVKWKDLAEFNYYKSLDHRSITWRTTDKRATSTRTLISEIKDRAAHDGYEGDQALNHKKDKAKEEHGSFYEVTMGSTLPRKMDLTDLPKPTTTLFTPHMSHTYSNNSWVQCDAYRIISYALERGTASPADKERCYRLWRDFLAPWFGLDISWMQSPAVQFVPSLVTEDEDEGEEDTISENKEVGDQEGDSADKKEQPKPTVPKEPKSYFDVEGHLPFPPGTTVSTRIGEAKIVKYLEERGSYELTDASGATKMLPVNSVFCTIFPIETSDLTDQLRANDQEVLERPDDNLMIGTQCMYLFLRLHQILVKRLNIAKTLASEVSKDHALGRHIEKLSYNGDPNEGKARYDAFISLVYTLLDAGGASAESSDGGKYEDRVRCLLGNQSLELTTMDKLISHILKSLQHMANDDVLQNMIEVYQRHKLVNSFKPAAFREEAALLSEGENMYAFQICNIPEKDEKILHYEFLGCIAEETDGEEGEEEERESNKRGIDEMADNTDDSAQGKRLRS